MIAIITGDIINSRGAKTPNEWLLPLKKLLNSRGKSPKVWEIYRGDGFQMEVSPPAASLAFAFEIKATIKSIKGLNVRMSVGIGGKNFASQKISESNGEAFIYSGERFEELKTTKQNLSIKTPWPEFDEEMNLYLRLGLIVMDGWTPGAAELVKTILHDTTQSQSEVAKKLGIGQSSVSERQKRAHLTEILLIQNMFKLKLDKHINK